MTGLLWLDGHHAVAGFFAGLALLSGPSIWFGLLGLALGWFFTSLFGKSVHTQVEEKFDNDENLYEKYKSIKKKMMLVILKLVVKTKNDFLDYLTEPLIIAIA